MKEFVSDEKESIEGTFSIGVIPTLAPYLLPLFLPSFVQNHPHTYLQIQELQTEQIIDQLNRGVLDIGILASPLEEKSIREVPLFYEPFLLFLPTGHPLENTDVLNPDRLDTDQLLVLEEGHCFREQSLALCKNRKVKAEMGFDFQSGSIEALKGLVQKGVGYTLVPELSVLNEYDFLHAKRFTSPQPVREISLAVHNNFTKEALIEHLRDSILKTIPEQLKKARKYTRVEWR